MSQGDVHIKTPKSRRNRRKPTIRVLTNKIVHARTEHQLACGCLLDKGKPYHRVAALYGGVFQYVKSHAGPCPKSGVIN